MPNNKNKFKSMIKQQSCWSFIFVAMLVMLMTFVLPNKALAFQGTNPDSGDLSYTIVEYKGSKFPGKYHAKDAYLLGDILCTSGMSEMTKEGEAIACDNTNDPTILVYPAWMIGSRAVSLNDNSVNQTSMSNMSPYTSYATFLFRTSGSGSKYRSGAGWIGAENFDDALNIDVNGKYSALNKSALANKTFSRGNIEYVMLYLHRIDYGFELYKNYRSVQHYGDPTSSNNVKEGYSSRVLTLNNGGFSSANSQLYYSYAPQVLGAEGLDNMILAIMDEGSGRPVPVYANGGWTGFSLINTSETNDYDKVFSDENAIVSALKTAFPVAGDDVNGYTSLQEVFNNSVTGGGSGNLNGSGLSYRYAPMTIQTSMNVNDVITIDTRSGLEEAIAAMGGPQYVGSIQLALNEAITTRNSTYNFMAPLATNGGTHAVGGNTVCGSNATNNVCGSGDNPCNGDPNWGKGSNTCQGVMKLSVRPAYMYVNSSAVDNNVGSKSPVPGNRDAGQNKDKLGVTAIRFSSNMSNSNFRLIPDGEGHNTNYYNRNFKYTMHDMVGGCYKEYGINNCVRTVPFNYFNEVEPVKFVIGGKSYIGYRLVPQTGVATGTTGVYDVEKNNGFSTFYIDTERYGDVDNSYREIYAKGQSDSYVAAWGIWRETGYSLSTKNGHDWFISVNSGVPSDSGELPQGDGRDDSSYQGRNGWASENNTTNGGLCRFPWKQDIYFNNEDSYNGDFLTAYIAKRNSGRQNYRYYDLMVDFLYKVVRAEPDMLLRMFEEGGNVESHRGSVNCGSSGAKYQTNVDMGNILNYAPGVNMGNIIQKLCDNLYGKGERTCGSLSALNSVLKASGTTLPNIGTEVGQFPTAYLAIKDMLDTEDPEHPGFTYGEHLAYYFYNFNVVISFPNEYSNGKFFTARRGGNYYSYESILNIDNSNLILLNEETRLGHNPTGYTENGVSQGTKILTAPNDAEMGRGDVEKYGPELYLVDNEGNLYKEEKTETPEKDACPKGWTQNGDSCSIVRTQKVNRSCMAGYVFDTTLFRCVEIGERNADCPDGFDLVSGKCISYQDTNPVCSEGGWDEETRTCIKYALPACNTNYELRDSNEGSKMTVSSTYSFTANNGDLSKFTGSNLKDLKQENDTSISYTTTTKDGYIQITGLNLSATNFNAIQLKVANNGMGSSGRIYYTTSDSAAFSDKNVVEFKMSTSDAGVYQTYIVDMSGSAWKSTITGLRFKLGGEADSKIIIDSIGLGKLASNYSPNYQCVSIRTPTCAQGLKLDGNTCYGYMSELSKNTMSSLEYEFDIDACETDSTHDKKTIVTAKVGEYVDFPYRSSVYKYVVPFDGDYYVELWGASNGSEGGGYSGGMKTFKMGDVIYIQVGKVDSGVATEAYLNGQTTAQRFGAVLGSTATAMNDATKPVTKNAGDWMKKITDIGNTDWEGEKSHYGDGYARITLYKTNLYTANMPTSQKTVGVSEYVDPPQNEMCSSAFKKYELGAGWNGVSKSDGVVVNGTKVTIPASQTGYVSFGNLLKNGHTYIITFSAQSTKANDTLYADAYPNTSTKKGFELKANLPGSYSWTLEVPNGDSVNTLRFYTDSEGAAGKVTIDNIIVTDISDGDASACGASGTTEFEFTGAVRTIRLLPGTYKFETWGAGSDSKKGGYSVGTAIFEQPVDLLVYAGGQGTSSANGWNSNSTSVAGDSDIAIGYVANASKDLGAPELLGSTSYSGSTWALPNGSGLRLHTSYNGLGTSSSNAVWRVDIEGTNLGNLAVTTSYMANSTGINGAGGSGSWTSGGLTLLKTIKTDTGVQMWYKATTNSSAVAWAITNNVGSTATISNVYFSKESDRIIVAGGENRNGFVYTTETAGSLTGSSLDGRYNMHSAQTMSGNSSFTSPSGETETGHIGNGYVRITNIIVKIEKAGTKQLGYWFETISTAKAHGACLAYSSSKTVTGSGLGTMVDGGVYTEARIKGKFSCANEHTYNETTGKCEKIQEAKCGSGSGTYDEVLGKCVKTSKPSGCSNNGEVYAVGSGYACRRIETPECPSEYRLDNGRCKKSAKDNYTNNACTAPYTINTSTGLCEWTETRPVDSTTATVLSGDLNAVELGKTYVITEYVGYKASALRSGTAISNGYAMTGSFPAISIQFKLFPNELDGTEVCRKDGWSSDTCSTSLLKTVPYTINLENFDIKKIFAGESVFTSGNSKNLGSYEPGKETSIAGLPEGVTANRNAYSKWTGENDAFLLESDFNIRWSAVDTYFRFEEDKFCYGLKISGEPISLEEKDGVGGFTCVDYVMAEGEANQNMTVMKDGKVHLNIEPDEDGKFPINSIAITANIDTPNSYVDSRVTMVNAMQSTAKEADIVMDNNNSRDDNADYIAEFKIAPDDDVYIDRFEVINSETGEVIFAADAMTEARCKNGYPLETGSTAKYTQQFKDYEYVEHPTEAINCDPFDPSGVIVDLSPEVNYYIKIYTKYAKLDMFDIMLDTPATIKTISLDNQHMVNTNSESGFAPIVETMSTAGLEDIYTIVSGIVSGTGNVELGEIHHDSSVEYNPTKGLALNVTEEGRCDFKATTAANISQFFKPTEYNIKGVEEPNSSLLIPATGFLNKGIYDGTFITTVGADMAAHNAYATWDTFPFRYHLGEGPDIEVKVYMKCGSDIFDTKTDSCTRIDTVKYKNTKCSLYVSLENIGSTDIEVSGNARVLIENKYNLNPDVVADGTIFSGERIIPGHTKVEILLRDNVKETTFVYATHTSADNEDYTDIDWSNNYDENWFCFDPVDYGISNLIIEDAEIKEKRSCTDNKCPTSITKEFTGKFTVIRTYDNQVRNVNIQYSLGTGTTCTVLSGPTTFSLSTDGEHKDFDYKIRCTINFNQVKWGESLHLRVTINGGPDGAHVFEEDTYLNNIASEYITTACITGSCTAPKCDDTCVEEQDWYINFDFIYQFDRNIVAYQTSKSGVNMSWIDYSVGTQSGATTDKSYNTTASSGNINRAPPDYMAFKSSTKSTKDLCTDYRAGNAECWRYEQNVYHTVTYYRWSQARSSVYTTLRVLKRTNAGANCSARTSELRYGYQNGSADASAGGSSFNYADNYGSSGAKATCHGYNYAPYNNECTVITDWWGNAICQSYQTNYDYSATGGSKPANYIPYANFQDWTLQDGYAMSPTTKTSYITLKSQTSYTNKNQGSNHTGTVWYKQRSMQYCTLTANFNISYSCPTYYTYGTYDGSKYYAQTTSYTYGVCYYANYSYSRRTCSWTNSTQAPTVSRWWPTNSATCYRRHRDYVCDRYYSFSNDSSYYYNSGNGTQGYCSWRETVTGTQSRWTVRDYDYDYNTCYSSCSSYKDGVCQRYSSGTCRATASGRCGSTSNTCYYSNGGSCSVSATWDRTIYYTSKTYRASDGQYYYTESSSCSSYPTIGSYTFYHSEYYDGSGYGRNMHYQCSSGDLNTGGYCYQTTSESSSFTDNRCITWSNANYYEVKYYTTETPTQTWTSRTYSNPTTIWQYTCDTKTPTVAYPNSQIVQKKYHEEIKSQLQIQTNKHPDWITVEKEVPSDIAPRRGEWFNVRFISTYSNTRGEKPGTLPYIKDFYNNYHNLSGGLGTTNTTTYPSSSYKHFGENSTGKTAIDDGKKVSAKSHTDIVNNTDYGYCDARPFEPYSCEYNGSTNQFQLLGENNHVETQGHSGAAWTTYKPGEGKCYYGPDNKKVWQKFDFGNDYETMIYLCTRETVGSDGFCIEDDAIRSDYLTKKSSACQSRTEGLCTNWKIEWSATSRDDGSGTYHEGFFIDDRYDMSKGLILDVRTSHFDAVAKYEQNLLGENTLNSNKTSTKYFTPVGQPIKKLCSCKQTEIKMADNYQWASTEWEVE